MGFLADIRYFGFAIGPAEGSRLAALKVQKALRTRRLGALLAKKETESACLRRLGLPENREARIALIRKEWKPIADSAVLRPAASRAAADRVLSGVQQLFGQDLAVGWPPRWEWRWDGTANATLFARDVRSTWELQRLQGILPLAAAAHGSGGGGAGALRRCVSGGGRSVSEGASRTGRHRVGERSRTGTPARSVGAGASPRFRKRRVSPS